MMCTTNPRCETGVVHAGVHASYLHTHPAAAPGAVGRFVTHAAARRHRRAAERTRLIG